MSDINTLRPQPTTSPKSSPQTGSSSLDISSSNEKINAVTVVDKVSEQVSEATSSGQGGGQSTKKDGSKSKGDDTTAKKIIPIQEPTTEEEYRKVLNTKIKERIDHLLIEVKKLQKNPSPETARALVDVVSELRKLTIMMKSLWQYTLEKLKAIYSNLFS